MAKVLCVLYEDPITGYPKSYPREDIPELKKYPDGMALPTPKHIDFNPGQLLGCVSVFQAQPYRLKRVMQQGLGKSLSAG